MLAGTFPICYLFQRYCRKPMHFIGRKLGLSDTGALGFIMVLANIIAVYHLFKGMRARDKVLCVAFGICAQATLGDHRVYRQLPTFAGAADHDGQILGGMIAVLIAIKIRCRKPNCWKKNRRKGSRRPSPPPLAEFSLSHVINGRRLTGSCALFRPGYQLLREQTVMRKIFLACPYSHADANVVQQRFIACNEVAAAIVRAGSAVFSPSACRIRSTCVCKNSTKPPSASCGRRSTPCSWRRWMS